MQSCCLLLTPPAFQMASIDVVVEWYRCECLLLLLFTPGWPAREQPVHGAGYEPSVDQESQWFSR